MPNINISIEISNEQLISLLQEQGLINTGTTEKKVIMPSAAEDFSFPSFIPTAPIAPSTSLPVQRPAQIQSEASMPVQTVPTAPMHPEAPAAPPTAELQYTIEQLQTAGVALVDAGKRDELQDLFKQLNIESLSELPAEQYGAFALKLKELGAVL